MEKQVYILDCTLRDGSYAVEFQYTEKDTALIGAGLENAGIKFIEVGHGLGLNASQAGYGPAAVSDEEYLKAAAEAFHKAKWGMFFIPGIGGHENLDLAADHGMQFVRIGVNVTEVAGAWEFVLHAKRLGLFVFLNFMKSYAVAPQELAARATEAASWGADVIYLVDSAGGMMPEDVRTYMEALGERLSVPIGFHGHDNLSLATANSLTAISYGASYIDTTLQGIGRGGGNVPTEVLTVLLKKRGFDTDVNVHLLMDIGQRLIKPMLRDRGWDPVNIVSGYAQFHSSYLKTIMKYARRYQVDPRDLIVGVCEIDRVHAPEEVVERVAKRLQEGYGSSRIFPVSLPERVFRREDQQGSQPLRETVATLAREMSAVAKKRGGSTGVLNVVAALTAHGKAEVSRFIQEDFGFVISGVELDSMEQLDDVVAAADGIADLFFVDSDVKPYLNSSLFARARQLAKKSRVIGYNDNAVWARTVAYEMTSLILGYPDCRIAICGTDNLALKLSLILMEQGARVVFTGGSGEDLAGALQTVHRLVMNVGGNVEAEPDSVNGCRDAQALVSFARGSAPIVPAMVEVMDPAGVVFDGGIGSVSPDAIKRARQRGLQIVRPDMRAALAGELAAVLGTTRIVTELMGRRELAGVSVVAGGLVGSKGEVVVDSITNPTKVIGVADGEGRLLPDGDAEYADAVAVVEEQVARLKIWLESVESQDSSD